MNTLPPLNTLRVFEAAGRLLSFNDAALELNLTPSAISHAIKSLEAYLGLALFDRPGRGVALTPEGKIYLTPVKDALTQLSNASGMLMRQSENHPLTISAAPALTIGWLMPRLARFQLAFPDIEVRLSSSADLVDLHRTDIDMAIRSGSGHWSGLASHFLMSEELVPVYKPGLLSDKGEALSNTESLKHAPLIHIMPTMGQWRSWLNALGIKHPDPEKGSKFESSAVAIEAAISGLGVALVPKAFVDEHLKAGRLEIPCGLEAPESYDFYVVYPSDQAEVPRIAAFRDWVLKEVE